LNLPLVELIFGHMKHAFILSLISLSTTVLCAAAQDVPSAPPPNPASDIAAQQGAEERYKRMSADMQALQMDNESMKAKIAALEQKIDDLRQQLAASANDHNSSVQEDIKRLAEKITEVDRKREEDKQAISEEIRRSIGGLEKSLSNSGNPNRPAISRSAPLTEPTTSQGGGFSYTIQEGDTLSAIRKAYNTDFKTKGWKTLSQQQIMDANPAVDWNRLRVGQKIVIPKPEGS
jgi:LysM repeat protein